MAPDAISTDSFARGRSQGENVKAVLEDIIGHGNKGAMLPGQIEANGAALSEKYGGLLFTSAEVDALGHIAEEAEFKFDKSQLKTVEL